MSVVGSPHQRARDYCAAIGKDPDELTRGYINGMWVERPRWTWMLGAAAESAERAMERSPTQRAVVEAQKRGGRAR